MTLRAAIPSTNGAGNDSSDDAGSRSARSPANVIPRLKNVSGLCTHSAAGVMAGASARSSPAVAPIHRRANGDVGDTQDEVAHPLCAVAAQDVALNVGEVDGDGAHHPIPRCSRTCATEYPG